MLDALTSDDFRPHIGTAFQLAPAEGEPFASELTAVDDGPAPEEGRASFSLVFSAPPDAIADQGTYRVEREGAEALDLFLVPIGPAEEGGPMRYEAVFG